MHRSSATQYIGIGLLIVIALSSVGHAQRTKSSLSAGEQRYAEKGLKDNRYFFYFINSSISNLGTDEEKKLFKEAIQRDMIAQLLYMKFLFHYSFVEIKRSQKILIDLYRMTLKRDIGITRDMLNDFARSCINSDLHKSKHYLKLGYRDLAVAKMYLKMADHYRETLYSHRLYKYVRAIKKAKHGKRYAFYSILEAQSGTPRYTAWSLFSFEDMENKIRGISDDKGEYYATVHYDNYYRTKNGKSFFDLTWENPQLEEIPEYQEYLNMR